MVTLHQAAEYLWQECGTLAEQQASAYNRALFAPSELPVLSAFDLFESARQRTLAHRWKVTNRFLPQSQRVKGTVRTDEESPEFLAYRTAFCEWIYELRAIFPPHKDFSLLQEAEDGQYEYPRALATACIGVAKGIEYARDRLMEEGALPQCLYLSELVAAFQERIALHRMNAGGCLLERKYVQTGPLTPEPEEHPVNIVLLQLTQRAWEGASEHHRDSNDIYRWFWKQYCHNREALSLWCRVALGGDTEEDAMQALRTAGDLGFLGYRDYLQQDRAKFKEIIAVSFAQDHPNEENGWWAMQLLTMIIEGAGAVWDLPIMRPYLQVPQRIDVSHFTVPDDGRVWERVPETISSRLHPADYRLLQKYYS